MHNDLDYFSERRYTSQYINQAGQQDEAESQKKTPEEIGKTAGTPVKCCGGECSS